MDCLLEEAKGREREGGEWFLRVVCVGSDGLTIQKPKNGFDRMVLEWITGFSL